MRGLIGLLLVVGLVLVYWKWIVAAIIVVLIVKAAPVAYREWQDERSAERVRLRGLIGRADEQHLWWMSDDLRGTHGDYPPPS